jgi:hypothetical protein
VTAERPPLLEQGIAAAVNMRRHSNLIAWATERGLFVRVDRATPWGNPLVLCRDGDRATNIARYRDDHLPFKPSLLARLGELLGATRDERVADTQRERDGATRWWREMA